MRTILLTCLTALGLLLSTSVMAQTKTVTGTVYDADTKETLPGVNVVVKGTTIGVMTDAKGTYSIRVSEGQILQITSIGYTPQEITVGASNQVDVNLASSIQTLGEVVVTALGIKEEKKNLGFAVTEIKGGEIAQAQRTNFVDALQGRVAGVVINQSSGLPGASSQVTIRGITSLSGSNQPLYVVDGLPYNNAVTATSDFASNMNTSSALNNRGVDFTNRGADINPEDIESVTVLKGPEATSLYGLDASNGAIIITTKRGKAGKMNVNYSNSFAFSKINKYPEIQRVYGNGLNGVADYTIFTYFGEKYPEGTKLYDNITNFFRTGFNQKQNLSFDGGTEKISYRISTAYNTNQGFIPNSDQTKWNISSAITSQITEKIKVDQSFAYTNDKVDGIFKGSIGPMLGLLTWPSVDDASVYLNPDGSKRTVFTTESFDNPYFSINKNYTKDATQRLTSVTNLSYDATSWLKFMGKFGFDTYSSNKVVLKHPESVLASSIGGSIDELETNSRNMSLEYLANINKKIGDFKIDFKVGGSVYDQYSKSVGGYGEKFLDPNFLKINAVTKTTYKSQTTERLRRVVGAVGILNINYKGIVNFQLNGRNDWSSTLAADRNSFFYPGVNGAFILTELPFFKGIHWLSFAKLRGAYAIARKDPAPYSLYPVLESQSTTGGGFLYGFTGPNPYLKPEKTTSFDVGGEVKLFDNRISIDASYYKKQSIDQIMTGVRMSYATGFVLNNLNGGSLWNSGVELQISGYPVRNSNFTWEIIGSYDKMWSKLTELPQGQTEYYLSDTWVYGNVRNGAVVGQPLTTLTGLPYLRNNNGDILINPATGLPIRSGTFSQIGDRNPDFTLGITNIITYKNFELSFLLDTRKGGDVFNATEHYLAQRGLSTRTLDRETPVTVHGVYQDGLENTATPTYSNIVIDRNRSSWYYTTPTDGFLNEEDYVEKDIDWIRMKDLTLRYRFSSEFLGNNLKGFKSLSVYTTFTDLFIITNYTGLDPVILGNNAAVNGTGSAGIDYGNFPLPMGINFGLSVGF
jgi:TonB-linked SusC/RagA family outer membrane protein